MPLKFFRRNHELGTPKQSILPKLFDRRNLEYAIPISLGKNDLVSAYPVEFTEPDSA